MDAREPTQVVVDSLGRSMILGLEQGSVAPTVILVDDTRLAAYTAKRALTERVVHESRPAFRVWTGKLSDSSAQTDNSVQLEATVATYLLGPTCMTMVLPELIWAGGRRFLCIGSCAPLTNKIHPGDLVVWEAATFLDTVTHVYADRVVIPRRQIGYQTRAPQYVGVTKSSEHVCKALKQAAHTLKEGDAWSGMGLTIPDIHLLQLQGTPSVPLQDGVRQVLNSVREGCLVADHGMAMATLFAFIQTAQKMRKRAGDVPSHPMLYAGGVTIVSDSMSRREVGSRRRMGRLSTVAVRAAWLCQEASPLEKVPSV